jgi:putative oxidoreductase
VFCLLHSGAPFSPCQAVVIGVALPGATVSGVSQTVDCRKVAVGVSLPRTTRRRARQRIAEEEKPLADWTSLRLAWERRMLAILRIMVGLLFLENGSSKLFNFPTSPNHEPYNLYSLTPGLQGPIELVGGLLIVFGLFTRPVAFILAGDMAAAYFIDHAPRNFYPMLNGGNAAILFCFAFLYLWVAGGGEWSLDRLLRRGTTSTSGAAR